jgi:predicted ATPase
MPPPLSESADIYFVGRSTQLEQLSHTLQSVIETRKPKFVLIEGDFGVGKTSLVEYFLAKAAHQYPKVMIGQGRCAKETGSNGLVPFNELLIDLSHQAINHGTAGAWASFLLEVAPAWIDVITAGIAGAAATTVAAIVKELSKAGGKTLSEGNKLMGRSSFSQENIFLQFNLIISRLADKHPIIAFIDDIHWADSTSLQLLFHLARNLREKPIMFVCTFRPIDATTGPNATEFLEVRSNLVRYGTQEVLLSEAGGIDVASYIAQRYPLNDFSDAFIREVQNRTEGHPLFVSQLFTHWEETDVIYFIATSQNRVIWKIRLGSGAEIHIPRELDVLLDLRVKTMEKELREILTVAAVEGEDFTEQVVARLRTVQDDSRNHQDLRRLERDYRFVQGKEPRSTGLIILNFYRFAHRFLREHVYYKHLNDYERLILHKQVAECLENLYPDHSVIAGQLAIHFSAAREFLKAAHYALVAARYEQSHFAQLESEKWCQLGLRCLTSLIESQNQNTEIKNLQMDLLEESGYGFYYTGQYALAAPRYQEVKNIMETVWEQSKSVDNTTRLSELSIILADIYDFQGQDKKSVDLLKWTQGLLRNHAVPFGEIHIRVDALLAYMYGEQGNTRKYIIELRKLLERAKTIPDTIPVSFACGYAYSLLGVLFSDMGQYNDSIKAFNSSLECSGKISNKWLQEMALVNIADVHQRLGELDESMIEANRAIHISKEIGDMDTVSIALTILGDIKLALGQPR